MSRLTVTGLAGGYTLADSILRGIDLTVQAGRLTAIIGPNGAGKSTLLKAVAGLIKITGGTIRFDERDITRAAPGTIAGLGIGFVPQEANVFASLSVAENLEMAGWLEPKRTRARLAELYGRFPVLAEKRREISRHLSGGQRQILAMAMAMMTAPTILLLDEPTAGLSPVAAAELFSVVGGIRADGVGIAMVEQNAVSALEHADDAYLLVDGRNAKTGSAADFLADESVRRMFLGKTHEGMPA